MGVGEVCDWWVCEGMRDMRETWERWQQHETRRDNNNIIIMSDITTWTTHHPTSKTYFRQIIFSQLYLLAKAFRDGSMMPPRKRNTKCSVDSFWML